MTGDFAEVAPPCDGLSLFADRLATCETVGARLSVGGGPVLGWYAADGTFAAETRGEAVATAELRVAGRILPVLQVGADVGGAALTESGATAVAAVAPRFWLRGELPDPFDGPVAPAAVVVSVLTPARPVDWTWLGAAGELGGRIGPVALAGVGGVDIPLVGEQESPFRPGLRWSAEARLGPVLAERHLVRLSGGVRGATAGAAYGEPSGVAAYAPRVGLGWTMQADGGWRLGLDAAIDPPVGAWGWNREAALDLRGSVLKAW